MIDTIHILYGALFLAVLLAVEGLFMLLGGDQSRRKAINRRMRMRLGGHTAQEVMHKLRRTERPEGGNGPLGRLDTLIGQAGLGMSALTLVLAMLVGAGVLWLLLAVVRNVEPISSAVIATVIAVGGPLILLRVHRTRRTKRFNEQLPDALDMAVRSLRAGHPVSAALKLVSEQMSDPIGTEIGIVVDEMTYGLDLREALDNLSRRIGASEVDFMVVAINIQHQAGGNLAEVLGGLSIVIRDRIKMVRKIRAISAEGKLSAWILSAMPFVVAGVVNVANPSHFRDVADDPLFLPGMAVLGGLLAVGIFTVFRMVRFRF
ncbi:MAG: type II secretion system F family protein [Rhodospirillaceae bacterium]